MAARITGGCMLRPMPLLLLVEDEPPIAETVAYALREDGFDVRHCLTAGAALAAAKGDRFDLAILDVGLPDLDGFALCRELRREADLAVIFLTAHAAEAERVFGFELGADDYVVKPFSPRELVARVRAVLRRTESPVADERQIVIAELVIDVPRRRVSVAGRPVELTSTEFELLTALARGAGRVFTRAQLLEVIH